MVLLVISRNKLLPNTVIFYIQSPEISSNLITCSFNELVVHVNFQEVLRIFQSQRQHLLLIIRYVVDTNLKDLEDCYFDFLWSSQKGFIRYIPRKHFQISKTLLGKLFFIDILFPDRSRELSYLLHIFRMILTFTDHYQAFHCLDLQLNLILLNILSVDWELLKYDQ